MNVQFIRDRIADMPDGLVEELGEANPCLDVCPRNIEIVAVIVIELVGRIALEILRKVKPGASRRPAGTASAKATDSSFTSVRKRFQPSSCPKT